MKKDKKESHFWNSTFGIKNPNEVPTAVSRLNFKDSEIDDASLDFITLRIKIIDQLDLDNTIITDEGISFLTRLEYLKELRLKGCGNVTDKSLESLNKLDGLELLHLYGTEIGLDNISRLIALQNLKMLFLSSGESEEIIAKKTRTLQILFPHCEILVNGKKHQD